MNPIFDIFTPLLVTEKVTIYLLIEEEELGEVVCWVYSTGKVFFDFIPLDRKQEEFYPRNGISLFGRTGFNIKTRDQLDFLMANLNTTYSFDGIHPPVVFAKLNTQ